MRNGDSWACADGRTILRVAVPREVAGFRRIFRLVDSRRVMRRTQDVDCKVPMARQTGRFRGHLTLSVFDLVFTLRSVSRWTGGS